MKCLILLYSGSFYVKKDSVFQIFLAPLRFWAIFCFCCRAALFTGCFVIGF